MPRLPCLEGRPESLVAHICPFTTLFSSSTNARISASTFGVLDNRNHEESESFALLRRGSWVVAAFLLATSNSIAISRHIRPEVCTIWLVDTLHSGRL